MKATIVAFLILTGAAMYSGAEIGEINVNAGPPPAPPERPKPLDRSQLILNAKTRVTVLLTDAKGRRTGVDPKTRENLEQIPNTTSEVDYVENRYTGEARAEAYQRLVMQPALTGTYHIMVKGLQDGPFQVDISALSRDGSSEPSKQLEGLISEGEQRSFELRYDSSPKGRLSLVEESGH